MKYFKRDWQVQDFTQHEVNTIFNGIWDPKPTESNANCGNSFMDTDLYNTMLDTLLLLDHSFGLNGKKILSCLKPSVQWISLKEQEECLTMKLATRRMQFNLHVIFAHPYNELCTWCMWR